MTTLVDRIPVDAITASGRRIRPGRVLVTLLLGLFMVPGWVIGRAWLAAADCAVSFRVGYWQGRGISAEEIARRLKLLSEAPRHEAPPGG